MKLPWQKNKEPAGSLRKIRAAVMPMVTNSRIVFNATENTFTVNSVSTHIVDLQPLQPGQTADDVAPFQPGTVNMGGPMISKEEAERRGIQRAQFNAPNWVGVLVASDTTRYDRNIDIPVWVDATGKIQSVDVEALLIELEPKRQRASEIWGQEEGVFADFHQLVQAPKNLFQALKAVASVPGEIIGAIKEIKNDAVGQGKPADPVPKHLRPDMSQYPPIDGMDYKTMIMLSVKPELLEGSGFTKESCLAAGKQWNTRIHSDWKLSTLYSTDVDRIRKGASPSWEWED